MMAGIGLTLLGSLLGALPILRVELRGGMPRVAETMGSLAVRLFVVLAGVLYALLLGGVATKPFLVWVGISYLLLLPLDVLYLIRSRSGVEDER